MSELEDTLCFQIFVAQLPEPVREFRFHPKRKWRFDFSWPELLIAAEVEGGIWQTGRHSRGAGYLADAEKYNEAILLGWRVFRFPVNMIRSGMALAVLEQALKGAP